MASIHDRVVFKQAGLDQRLQYDEHPRKSLLDLFYDDDADLHGRPAAGRRQRGDFLCGVYEARIRRNPNRIQVHARAARERLRRAAADHQGLTARSRQLHAARSPTCWKACPRDRPLHFAVEFNFAGLPAGADDRYFSRRRRQRGSASSARSSTWTDDRGLGLVDEWLGIDVGLHASRPTGIWTFPIETVSQSEGGFELVHQSVVVLPHWFVKADLSGNWRRTLTLSADTRLAEFRGERAESQLLTV